ncbi:MAG: virulence RhuM family protein, partial [Lewinellaceae bacterium]|nr:virulence RhuM family protein [Lewinellaceae bacterium]
MLPLHSPRRKVEVRCGGGETFWLSEADGGVIWVDVRTVNEQPRGLRIRRNSIRGTVRKFRIVQQEGDRQVTREIDFYNLDAIIAVGYRVNSMLATQFRIWATQTLREFILKGFVLDDERLKQGKRFGKDYFEELLERIRE